MRRVSAFEPQFVDRFPTPLDPGVLYVALAFRTAAHLCACGCGNKVITPLSPAAWSLTFDGETVSLDPSIGNGRLPCRSHYFIRGSHVRWAPPMTEETSRAAQRRDALDRARYYGTAPPPAAPPSAQPLSTPHPDQTRPWWRRLRDWWGSPHK